MAIPVVAQDRGESPSVRIAGRHRLRSRTDPGPSPARAALSVLIAQAGEEGDLGFVVAGEPANVAVGEIAVTGAAPAELRAG